MVVDVRSMPRSRSNPQFNGEDLPATLAPWQIGYEHIAELGGHRPKARDVEGSPNAYWRGRGVCHYTDHSVTKTLSPGPFPPPRLSARASRAGLWAGGGW